MELYVLTNNFLNNYVIDKFVSLIWTERYTSAGDVQLVLVPTKFYVDSLTPGTFLSIPESKEIMVIETQLIDDGLLKISGHSLISILNQRFVWEPDLLSTLSELPPIDYKDDTKEPGYFISFVVSRFAIAITPFPSPKNSHGLDDIAEEIPNLTLGAIDTSGVAVELVAPLGPLYDAVKSVAETYHVGMSLYLAYANSDGSHSLKFKTYKGTDRTSDQSSYKIMRLTQSFEEISDVAELRTNVDEINCIYVFVQSMLHRYEVVNGVVTANPPAAPSLGHRVKILHPKLTPELFYVTGGAPTLYYFPLMGTGLKTAEYYLSQYKPIHIVNANIKSLLNYKFGTDYGLGDIIEIESLITGAISKAQVTEYIRSHDSLGERGYPTIAIES